MASIEKIFIGLIIAAIAGALGAFLFRSVLPPAWATLLGLALALVELAGSLRGAGLGLRAMLRLGEVTLAWPVAAWLVYGLEIDVLGNATPDRGIQVGLGAAAAAAVGILASRHGTGKDTARLVTVLIACMIPAGALLAEIASGDRYGVIAATIACAVAPLTAGMAHVWPDGHHQRLALASAACVASGLVVALATLV